jgi:nitrile hydratase
MSIVETDGKRIVDTDGKRIVETDGEALLVALRSVLAAKGIASPAEIAERIASTDSASPGQGARMVAKAWTDPAYRARLLEDGAKAAEELGIPMRGMPPLGVLEDSAELHHLVVCTLCSCYPRAVLGYPPFWYKSAGYRARAVRDPRGLLADEWGTMLPDSVRLSVVDSTADYRWMVLPLRPAGTEGWDEQRLASIVREGDMIGVTIPKV